MGRNEMRQVILDARRLEKKQEAWEYLKRQIQMPQSYGSNLDALYDYLTETGYLAIQVVHGGSAGGYSLKILQVLRDACQVNTDLTVIVEE